jgi:hypothetical protein
MVFGRRRVGDRHLARPADERNVMRCQAHLAAQGVPADGRHEPQGLGGRPALDPFGESVERNLSHHCGDPVVISGGGDGVRPAEGVAPQHDTLGVDGLAGSGAGNRRTHIGQLRSQIHDLPWIAAAAPEAAVIEHQHRKPGTGEDLGPGKEAIHRAAEPAAHHDTRHRIRGLGNEQMARSPATVAFEGNVDSRKLTHGQHDSNNHLPKVGRVA